MRTQSGQALSPQPCRARTEADGQFPAASQKGLKVTRALSGNNGQTEPRTQVRPSIHTQVRPSIHTQVRPSIQWKGQFSRAPFREQATSETDSPEHPGKPSGFPAAASGGGRASLPVVPPLRSRSPAIPAAVVATPDRIPFRGKSSPASATAQNRLSTEHPGRRSVAGRGR
jgi:hypothetical protein